MKNSTSTWILTALLVICLPGAALARGNDDAAGIVVGIVIGSIILFLICRELICWYYKINEHSRLLEDIRSELRAMNAAKGVAVNGGGAKGTGSGSGTAEDSDSPDAWS